MAPTGALGALQAAVEVVNRADDAPTALSHLLEVLVRASGAGGGRIRGNDERGGDGFAMVLFDGRSVLATLEIDDGPETDVAMLDEIAVGVGALGASIGRLRDISFVLDRRTLRDPLTGLPNRALLMDRLQHALARTTREGGQVAVLYGNVDRFCQVNDGHGHDVGDDVLLDVGHRICRALRPGDTASRLGGDEFVVVCPSIDRVEVAMAIAERLRRAIAEPDLSAGSLPAITLSLGIALSTGADRPAGAILQDADAAMRRAKSQGGDRWELFTPEMRSALGHRSRMETDLVDAVALGQLRTLYQPIIRLGDDRLVGVEALVRWDHPELGLLPPADFLGTAEETGLIVALGEWVLRTACEQAAKWRAAHPAQQLSLAVNLSAAQLGRAAMAPRLRRVLADTGLPPDMLCLELTETVLVEASPLVMNDLHAVKALGVRVAVDDFGTGWSSLTYLKRLPLDTVKVDRSFVAGLGHDPHDEAIVSAVLELGRALDLETVGEGVETAEQMAHLRRLGCEQAQGFHLGMPVDAAEIDRMLAATDQLVTAAG